jgi:hypothetical protein
MAKEESPDTIATKSFVLTMIGTAIFVLVVAIFVLR